ncbi:MAG: signal peptidase II [Synergistetes bacterium]|nr:signal peptidase II [Synergistota bacterium]
MSKRLKVKWILLFLLLFSLDRIMKYVAMVFFPSSSRWVVKGLVSFSVVRNEGIAFGMGGIPSFVVVMVGFAVMMFLILGFDNGLWFEYILLLSGVAGNLLDRLFYGYVVDFICVKWWYTFNIADIFIVIGGVLVILKKIKSYRLKGA